MAAAGYTLLELVLVVAIIGILAAIAVPAYRSYSAGAENTQAITDIGWIAEELKIYLLEFGAYPASLDDLQLANPDDPWGNPYQYFRILGGDTEGKGKLRKDKNLVPINTGFDLYSMGPDGDSVGPLTAKPSRDDIVWANDGGYVGVAADY